ncbi:hypothetical protein [Aeromonas veronii]|uniref:hypothetical protein n=1 Tax=Aeromonas veronii TaxID=654 RepID=UPI0040556E6A
MNIVNCERKIENINTLLSNILDDPNEVFFKKTNLLKPDFVNKELSFVRLVSWLYSHYYETGKNSLGIINSTMSDEIQKQIKSHKDIIQNWRTILQHNIDRSTGSRDYKIEKDCLAWTKKACGKSFASSEDDWLKCSSHLVNEAEIVFENIISVLDEMTNSNAKKHAFIENWKISTDNEIAVHHFDEHIAKLLNFIEPENFNIVLYRNKNLAQWRNHVKLLNPTADYKNEIKKIIESSIVRDFIRISPVTLTDLEEYFILSRESIFEIYKVIDQEVMKNSLNKESMMIMLLDKCCKFKKS